MANAQVVSPLSEVPVATVRSTHHPATRPEEIHYIVDSVERYNPSSLSVLVEYVEKQANDISLYDLEACLATLKLYQFNPDLAKTQVISQILALALTQLPDPDFTLCLYLLNEHYLSDPTIKLLTELHGLLQENRYPDFWESFKKHHDDVGKLVKKMDQEIRNNISRVISITFSTISLNLVEKYLGLSGEGTKSWLQKKHWSVDESTKQVTLPIIKENQAMSSMVHENIEFEQLTKIIARSNEK